MKQKPGGRGMRSGIFAIAATKLRRAARLRPCKAVDAFGLTTLSQGRSRHPASTRAFGSIHLVHPFRIKARLPVRPADRLGGRFADGSQQRSEETTSELQSLKRTSYAAFHLTQQT